MGDTRYNERADQQGSLPWCAGDEFWAQLNPGVPTTRKGRVGGTGWYCDRRWPCCLFIILDKEASLIGFVYF